MRDRRLVEAGESEQSDHLPLRIGEDVANSPNEVVYVLTRYLAGKCDGARVPDGQGFNKIDAKLGHSLADQPFAQWTPRQLWAARRMLTRYSKRQLLPWWSAVPDIEEPVYARSYSDLIREQEEEQERKAENPNWVPQQHKRTLTLDEVHGKLLLVLRQELKQELVSEIKSLIPQKQWHPKEKFWSVPLQIDCLEPVFDIALRWGYDIPDVVYQACDVLMGEFARKVGLSNSAESDYDIPGLNGVLYPFQRAGVEYANTVHNVLIADEPGLGKTMQALGAVQSQSNYPVIVICPASVKQNWAREAKKWLPHLKIAILTGTPRPLVHFDGAAIYDMVIVNYNVKVLDKWMTRLVNYNPGAIICDEAHALKNHAAQQTQAVEYLLENTTARRIFLSGTPVVNRPMEFFQIISLLGYADSFGGIGKFKRRYDKADVERLHELNTRARTICLVRRRKQDVLKDLPDKMYTDVPLEIDNREEYDKAEKDIAHYFAMKKIENENWLAETTVLAKINAAKLKVNWEDILEHEKRRRYQEAYGIGAQNERMLRWEALKQTAAKGKRAQVQQWIGDFLANSDEKLVVFGLHTEDIEMLSKMYASKFGAVHIHGGVQVDKRMPLVDRFQNDPKCRLIIGNMNAMGEGLTLTAASNLVFYEFGWNPKTMDQAADRCHRIGQKNSVTIWNLVAMDTIDQEIVKLIADKRQVVDAIQDGAGADSQMRFMQDLEERLMQKKSSNLATV